MSLVTRSWPFTHTSTNEVKIVSAIDGPTAWKRFAEQVGEKKWHGGFEIPTPNPWNIGCVCICGEIQSTSFCSERCFQTWKKETA